MNNYFNKNIDEVFTNLKTNANGLTQSEAVSRLNINGKNKLVQKKGTSLLTKFIKQLIDPMIVILIFAAIISAVLAVIQGDSFADVIIIGFVVIVNAILGVYQENKAEKAIEALNEMSALKSKVLRDGHVQEIYSEDIVVGDVVILEAGDAIPADGRIIESTALKIEESALTGESEPVSKCIDILTNKKTVLADRKNMAYMGSTVVYGRGAIVVTSTGMETEMGKIADVLDNTLDNKTPLQIKMSQLSKVLTLLIIGICAMVFIFQLIQAQGLGFKNIIDSFMIAISLAVAAIPEGLPAVVTVVLSIGVTNMSKRNAIIRKLTAVETLGCAQIICSDKTGTLTQNKMSVVDFYGEEDDIKLAMGVCNDVEDDIGEPTELALSQWANVDKSKYKRIDEIPFDSKRKMMSTLNIVDGKTIQFTKGAPDVVLDNCINLNREEVLKANQVMANKALRVLACALKNTDKLEESDMTFIGLVGMIDPVRDEVKDSIKECKSAGIVPIMITGDHVDTACAIAKELDIHKKSITGNELNEMSDEEFEKVFQDITVYARVQPEHKTRIVKAWQNKGFVVAMTGDGVNDAPSIKTADIGIGMGITGTDVTKNVADMVLADDNFATIVHAVEEGRRIYDNIRKSIQFLLCSNMSEVIAVFVASIFGFLLFKPVHLLWINLITDCFPALALGMEKAEPGLMNRRPRDGKDGLFSNGVGFDIVYQGIIVAVLTLISYCIGGTTMAFLTMSIGEIFHSFNMRSQRQSMFKLNSQNKFLWIAAIGALFAILLVCEIPFLAQLFQLENLSIVEYVIAILLASSVIPIVEIVKLIQRNRKV